MSQYLVSEEQVKKALKIDNFRNISKKKIIEFVSLIPKMDKDIAIAIINQFPVYAENAAHIIEQLNVMCNNVLKSNDSSQMEVIYAYKIVLDSLSENVKKDDISSEERQQYIKQMVEIADKISDKDTENKKFLDKIYKYGATIVSGVLILGAVILGVNVKSKQIPELDEEDEDNDNPIINK